MDRTLRLALTALVAAALLVSGAPPGRAHDSGVGDVSSLTPTVQSWTPGQGAFHLAEGARLAIDPAIPASRGSRRRPPATASRFCPRSTCQDARRP